MNTIKNWLTSRKQTNLDEAFYAVYNNFPMADLKKVARKGIRNSSGLTLLHQAVLDDNLEKVNLLCSAGIDMYAVCQKKTALHMALLLCKSAIALALLKHGCDPEHKAVSSQFYHPWHIVMSIVDRRICLELTSMLITHDADVNREIRLSQQIITNLPFNELQGMRVCRDFAPVIQLAIGRNDPDLVEKFLKSEAELWRTCNSCSVLTRCLTLDIKNRLEIVKLLLQYELEINDAEELIHTASDCSWDFTPLQISILCRGVDTGEEKFPEQTDKLPVLRTLLDGGANPSYSAAECKFHFCPGRPQPSLPVPIHEENPCLYPLCLAVQQLWVDGVLELVKSNCAVNWDLIDHMPASRTEHANPIHYALLGKSENNDEYLIRNSDRILQILHLLYDAGSDFFIITDDCVDQLHNFISSHRKHPLSEWFQMILTSPPSLKIITRCFIRKHLGSDLRKRSKGFDKYIPPKIIDYILFNDSVSL